ncbi:MAG TPA: TetR/AcrR family transcriptional regulator [Candidatus Binataceae bacterium]|nr:TetR/AcrR family transcriptional regulator [Candidatus Binataceae bacterium]
MASAQTASISARDGGPRPVRQDNRRVQLLDAAAKFFSEHGFHGAAMRDIARAAGMLSGSIYYHFDSKEEMLLAVYEEGLRRVEEMVDRALVDATGPWGRLEAACGGHLNALIIHRDYARVMIQTTPAESPGVDKRIRELRRGYESRFRNLIDDLALPPEIDRSYLRFLLFGALNWSQVWFRPGGDSPEIVAHRFIEMLRLPLDAAKSQ